MSEETEEQSRLSAAEEELLEEDPAIQFKRKFTMKEEPLRAPHVPADKANYLDIDWLQYNEDGEEVLMRITVPIIRVKKKREFRRLTRKTIFEVPQDDIASEAAEEEGEFQIKEDIIKYVEVTAVVETVTKTVLIHSRNEEGEMEEIEYDVVEEFIIGNDPSKFKVVAVKKILSDGEEILEEHITPEESVEEPYVAIEGVEEFAEEFEEEEATTIDELRLLEELQEEEEEEEEEEEDLELSLAELAEEESAQEELEEMDKEMPSTAEEEEEDVLDEYIEEESTKKILKDKLEVPMPETSEKEEEGYEAVETEEEESKEEKLGNEEVLVARYQKDYGVVEEKEETVMSEDIHKEIESESSEETEEESVEEETEEEEKKYSEKIEQEEVLEDKKHEESSVEGEETVEEGIDIKMRHEKLKDEKHVSEEESEIEEDDKYWWRTSKLDIDDFELPDDQVKANKILQAELWRQVKLHDKYINRVEKYFRSHKEEICYFPPYLEVEELKKFYEQELKELKQILDTFSDSYDDFNFMMYFVRKRNKKNDKIFNFLMESLKKLLFDMAKKTDKRLLTKISKGKTLEEMIIHIFQLEDDLSFAYTLKAIDTLECEEMKYMLYSGDKDQSNIQLDDRLVDLLVLADLQSKCHHSSDYRLTKEFELKTIMKKYGSILENICFDSQEASYNKSQEKLCLERVGKQLEKTCKEKERKYKMLLEKLSTYNKNCKANGISEKRIQRVRDYIKEKYK